MEHRLKNKSSFIVVVLKSLMHKSCIRCGYPIHSLEESIEHWESELEKTRKLDLQKSIEELPLFSQSKYLNCKKIKNDNS